MSISEELLGNSNSYEVKAVEFTNGNVYQGGWSSDLKMDGQGKYYLKNDLNKAISYTKQALELQPYDKDNLIHLAGYYALNKEFSKARPIFESLLSSEPKNEYYQYLIKTLDEDEKNYKQTESD